MPKLDVQNREHRALKRLIIAARDIGNAKAAVQCLLKHTNNKREHELFDPLHCAAVISYARPFVEGHNSPRLRSRYSRFSDVNLRKVHAGAIRLRNSFVAHSDQDLNEVELIPKGEIVTWNGGKSQGVIANHGHRASSQTFSPQALQLFLKLCEFQLSRLTEDIDSEKKRLFPS